MQRLSNVTIDKRQHLLLPTGQSVRRNSYVAAVAATVGSHFAYPLSAERRVRGATLPAHHLPAYPDPSREASVVVLSFPCPALVGTGCEKE